MSTVFLMLVVSSCLMMSTHAHASGHIQKLDKVIPEEFIRMIGSLKQKENDAYYQVSFDETVWFIRTLFSAYASLGTNWLKLSSDLIMMIAGLLLFISSSHQMIIRLLYFGLDMKCRLCQMLVNMCSVIFVSELKLCCCFSLNQRLVKIVLLFVLYCDSSYYAAYMYMKLLYFIYQVYLCLHTVW